MIKKFSLLRFIKKKVNFLQVRPARKFALVGFVLILIVVSAYFLFFSSSEVLAEWWNTNWHYRKSITITNNTSQETDVYVSVTLDTSDTNKFQVDCGDIRFAKLLGDTLPYYIVSGCGSTSTIIHIEFDVLPAGAQIIYYYYGNSSASDGFSSADLSTQATNYTIGSLGTEEKSPGPVAYWSFDEGYGTTAQDRTSNNSDGTITGATWQTEDQCIAGKCLYFDGDGDYIELSIFTIERAGGSICFWYKSLGDYNDNYGARGVVISQRTSGYRLIALRDNGTAYRWESEGNTNGDYLLGTGYLYKKNKWRQLCMIADSNTVYSYLDAQLIDTEAADDDVSFSMIGAGDYDYADPIHHQFFHGYLDEIKVYDYARTEAQIKTDYNAGLAGVSSASGVSVAMGGQSQKSLSDGLVGYWKMDESSGNAADSSGNGNTGAWNGTGSHYPAGKFGNGGGFNGIDDWVDLPTFVSANGISHTIGLWVKRDDYDADPYNVMGTDLKFFITYYGSAQTYDVVARLGDGTDYLSLLSYDYGDTEWHHVSFVIDRIISNKITLYVDGNEIDSENIPDGFGSVNLYTDIGGKVNSWYLDGSIDDIRIYNRAFTEREVKALYEWAPGPVIEWKFDEKTDSATYDTSGNNNTGTLYNMEADDWRSSAECIYGGCVNVDETSSESIQAPHSAELNPLSLTVEGWFNLRNRSNRHVVITKWNGYSLEISSSGYPYFRSSGITPVDLTSTQAVTWGQWHHIAANFDDITKEKKIYIDGIETASEIASGTIAYQNNPFRIGYIGNYMDGLVDDVRVYNYARTQK